MNRGMIRPILAPLVGAALCFLLAPRPYAAATATNAFIAHYVARAVDAADNGDDGRIDIYIERWSSSQHRGALVEAMNNGPERLLPALESMRIRDGVLLMPGVQAVGPRVRSPRPRNLFYTQLVEGSGGRQIVVAADQHIGLGHYERWGAAEDPEFTLIDIRLGPDGSGVAKAATATEVAYNATAQTFEIKDFASQPVRLREVKAATAERIVSARYYQPR